MKVLSLGVFLLLSFCLAFAEHNTETPNTLSLNQEEEGKVWPCNVDFWVTNALSSYEVGQYLELNVTITDTDLWDLDSLDVYVQYGSAPVVAGHDFRPVTYDLALTGVSNSETIFIYCGLQEAEIYIAVVGGESIALPYSLELTRRDVDIFDLSNVDGTRTLTNVERPENEDQLAPENYHHYSFSIPPYAEGQYLTVNISYVETNATMPTLRVNYNALAMDEGNCYLYGCENSNNESNECFCTPDEDAEDPEDDDNCAVVVVPCTYLYTQGFDYYFSVELPAGTSLNYTIHAEVDGPTIKNLTESVPEHDVVTEEETVHYLLTIPENLQTETANLRVTVSNVVGGTVTVSVDTDHITGVHACEEPIVDCTTSWHCNIVIPTCTFYPLADSDWYVAVDAVSIHRDPIRYTIVAVVEEEPEVKEIVAGEVVTNSVYENEFHYYSLEIPEHVDTYLHTELYVNRNDTEVALIINQETLTGYVAAYDFRTNCFEEQEYIDFTCVTSSENEACNFHIPRCQLYPGTIYFAVLGIQEGMDYYGDNTYYNVPADYTLWVDLIEPRKVLNNVSYSEVVYNQHYNHYYITVDTVTPGEHLSVRFSNIQGGTLVGYINYEDMAGECPCYEYIETCSDDSECVLEIDTCIYQPGVYYISTWGIQDGETLPVGYTMTPSIHPAPEIWELQLDQIQRTEISSGETHFYKLDAGRAGKMDNLVVKIVSERQEYSFDSHVSYDVFPSAYWNEDDEEYPCYEKRCNIDNEKEDNDDNYCVAKLHYCQYYGAGEGIFYIRIHAVGDEMPTLYTVRAQLETEPVWQLTSGQTVYGRVENQGYHHYALTVPASVSNVSLVAEIYTNSEQDRVSFRMNVDEPAGYEPCLNYLVPYECNTTNSCFWKLEPCQLQGGSTYYFSVFGEAPTDPSDERYVDQYFDMTVEYTLTVSLVPTATPLQFNEPIMALVYEDQINHYYVDVPPLNPGEEVVIEVGNVRHGSVVTYLQLEDEERGVSLAGPCPCYFYDERQSAIDTDEARIVTYVLPSCMHAPGGRYFLSVYGSAGDKDEDREADALGWTATGYTISVYYKIPNYADIQIGDARFGDKLVDQQYFHYNISTNGLQTYPQFQVYLENIEEGSLMVLLNKGHPAQDFPGCYDFKLAQQCEGEECYFALPDCLFDDGEWYLSVKATTSDEEKFQYDVRTEVEYPTTISLSTETNYTSIYGFSDHYRVNNVQNGQGRFLIVEVTNVDGGSVDVFINQGALAGIPDLDYGCPACNGLVATEYNHFHSVATCSGDCKYVVPSCELINGEWYVTIVPSDVEVNYTLAVFNPDSDQDVSSMNAFEVVDVELTDEYQWAMYTLNVPVAASGEGAFLEITVTMTADSTSSAAYVHRGDITGGDLCDEFQCVHDFFDGATACTYKLGPCCTVADTYYIGFQQRAEGTVTGSIFAKYWDVEGEKSLTVPGSVDASATGNGVTNDNYHFYRFQFSEETLASSTAIRFNLTVDSASETGVTMYLREFYLAGEEDSSVGCYEADYVSDFIGVDVEYVTEFPSCTFTAGVDYVVGVRNAAAYPNDLDTDLTEALYTLEVATYSTKSYSIGSWVNTTVNDQFYAHYVFEITADDIIPTKRDFIAEVIVEDGSVDGLFIGYEGINTAAYESGCNPIQGCSVASDTSGDNFFHIRLDTCSLEPGTYYATIRFTNGASSTDFDFRAFFETDDYDLKPGNEVSSTVFRYAPLVDVDLTDSDQSERFISINVDAGEVGPHTALVVNVTNVEGGSVTVYLTKDCQTWSCSTSGVFDAPGSCLIHSSGAEDGSAILGPCSLATGEYLIRVVNPSLANVTVTPYLIDPPTEMDLSPTYDVMDWDSDYLFEGFHQVWTVNTPDIVQVGWASLEVDIFATCGAIEAWINYENPAGPTCSLAHCMTSSVSRQDAQVGANDEEDWDRCTLSLDPCHVYANSTYYVTVRAVAQAFETEHDNLPVHYEIFSMVDYQGTAPLTAQCYPADRYDDMEPADNEDSLDPYDDVLSVNYVSNLLVYYYDLDTFNPGTTLTVSLHTSTPDAVLYVSHETWLSSEVDCGSELNHQCNVGGEGQDYTCEVTFTNCELQNGRYYVFFESDSDDYFSGIVYVHREQVDVFYPEEETYYVSTVGLHPYTYTQYYKFIINPDDKEFLGSFHFTNVMDGEITVYMGPMENDMSVTSADEKVDASSPEGWRPDGPGCALYSCSADENTNCTIRIHPSGCRHYTSDTWFAAVVASSQDEDDLSVTFTFYYELYPEVSTLPLDTPICDEVQEDAYDHWKLKEKYTAETELVFYVTPSYETETVRVALTDIKDRLASNNEDNNNLELTTDGVTDVVVPVRDVSGDDEECANAHWDNPGDDGFVWQCAYDDLHLSVFGIEDDNDRADEFQIPYLIEVTKRAVDVTAIDLDTDYTFCPGRYYFKFNITNSTDYVEVQFAGAGSVYLNYKNLASEYCHVDSCTAEGWCNIVATRLCHLPNGLYYLTVDADSEFSLRVDTTAWEITDLTSEWVEYESDNTDGYIQTYDFFRVSVTQDELDQGLQYFQVYVSADSTTVSDVSLTIVTRLDSYEVTSDAEAFNDACVAKSGSSTVLFGDMAVNNDEVAWVEMCDLEPVDYIVLVEKNAETCNTDAEWPVVYNIKVEKYFEEYNFINVTNGVAQTGSISTVSGSYVIYRFDTLKSANEETPLWVSVFDVDQDVELMVEAFTVYPANYYSPDWNTCAYASCSTVDNDNEDLLHVDDTGLASCDFDLDGCVYSASPVWYFKVWVNPEDQTNCGEEYTVNYSFMVEQVAWTKLSSKKGVVASIDENREMQYFSFDTSAVKSVTVSLDVVKTEFPLQVALYSDSYCDNDWARLWEKECDVDQYCDLEIPTWAAHPENKRTSFYVVVHGNRANYTITLLAGSDNCAKVDFSDDSFCDNTIVPYSTWSWRDWERLDEEARCLYDQIWETFHNHDACIECREAVRTWACVSTFRSCDASGFITPVCSDVCEYVVNSCEYTFDEVELTEYNCTSHRYADKTVDSCSGEQVNPNPDDTGSVSPASVVLPTVAILVLAALALFL